MSGLSGSERKNITPGISVAIIQKKDQRSGALTFGIVKDILTKAPVHTRGIKVRLQTGEIGRVHSIDEEN